MARNNRFDNERSERENMNRNERWRSNEDYDRSRSFDSGMNRDQQSSDYRSARSRDERNFSSGTRDPQIRDREYNLDYSTDYSRDYDRDSSPVSGFGYSITSVSTPDRSSHVGKGPKGWRRSDDNVKEQVCDALERDHGVDASEIEVSVNDGVVTLTGKVDHRSSKRRAEDALEHLAGVKDIRNELTVDQSFFQQAKELIMGESDSSDKGGTRTKSSRH